MTAEDQQNSTKRPQPPQPGPPRNTYTDKEYVMTTFGNHSPAEVKDRGARRGIGAARQWVFQFPNGFGASVINDGYGSDNGLYELAVLTANGSLTYKTPITDDVIGWLTEEQVTENLDKIAALTCEVVEAEITRRAAEARDHEIAQLRERLAALESGAQS